MKIRLFEMFAGFGGASFALKKQNIPFECVGYSEIDKTAIKVFKKNHGNIKNYGDCRKINPKKLPDFDILTGGFPCCPKGTLIDTKKGYKKIEEITTNDKVITHKNQYQKVNILMQRVSDHINKIKAVGVYDLNLTDEHPLYVHDKGFKWKKTKDLKVGDYISFNINQRTENPLQLIKEECWLIGRYCADGSIENRKRKRLYFSIGKSKRKEFEEQIRGYDYFMCHPKRNCQEFYIRNERLEYLCNLCGTGSINKIIPKEIINLPVELLKVFLEGYISGDGHIQTKPRKRKMFSTVSEKMALGLQQCFIKTEQRVCSISKREDNRSKTFNDSFNGQIANTNRDSFIVNDKVMVKIKSIERIEKDIKVYNIEVEEDNSYTCNNIITHNCQPFSVNTNHKVRGDTHKDSNLYLDIIRILEVKRPKYIFLENVKGILGKKSKRIFEEIVQKLKDVGYNLEIKLVNSRNYGTPQNRERVLFIGVLKEYNQKIEFPKTEELEMTVKDILEENPNRREPRIKNLKLNKESNLEKYGDISRIDAILKNKVYKNKSNVQYEILDAPSDQVSRQSDRIYKPTYSPTLTATGIDYLFEVEGEIIVLTPKECFRLMGFFGDEINLEGLRETQKHRLAGNGWDISTVSKFLGKLIKFEKQTILEVKEEENVYQEIIEISNIKELKQKYKIKLIKEIIENEN